MTRRSGRARPPKHAIRARGDWPPPSTAPGPPQDQLPAWRSALIVYRQRRLEGDYDSHAVDAGVVAYLSERPDVDPEAALAEVMSAIYWASVNHNDWLFPRNPDGSSKAIPNPYQRAWADRHKL